MRYLMLSILILGFLDSSYLLYTHYSIYTQTYCPVDICIPPELPFPSYIFAFFGVIWFLAGIILIFKKIKFFLRIWQTIGLVGAVSLFSYSLYIGFYCPYCYFAHLIGFFSVIISWKFVKY
ncbi:MAG: hypothetical protein RMH75_03710 [Archaeoglobaceae archaeon]|nr:hypothetical protein [Archaeoglobaceae archaeon]MDW7989759.1 hypothetical protein [Archaeoglobaceae archaeon]